MEDLHWPLTVLSRAIHYKNLTAAAQNIGLSQPQLSRIVSRLESELSLTLLDRESRRKSGWTKEARKLGEIYLASSQSLQKSIETLLEGSFPKAISIGSLEGLTDMATGLAHSFLQKTQALHLDVDIYDLAELQDQFARGNIDLILTSNLPAAKKSKYILELGYQTLDLFSKGGDVQVMSSYEFRKRRKKLEGQKRLVSNSLGARRNYLQGFGGQGLIPSSVIKEKPVAAVPVYLLGADYLTQQVWEHGLEYFKSI